MSDDLIKLRLFKQNKISDEIKLLEKYNSNDDTTLRRIRKMNATDKYVIVQTEKLTKAIKERQNTLEQLINNLEDLKNGLLDNQILQEIKDNTRVAKMKSIETFKIKAQKLEDKKEDEKISKDYYEKNKESIKQEKAWYYKSATKHFFKACNTIPAYMKAELKNMPCNHGFLWQGVYCFGEKQETSKTEYKITENKKGLKIITRWDKDFITVHEKPSRSAEKLISKKPRNKK